MKRIDKPGLFGVCELFEGAVDAAVRPEQTVDLAAALGCKSMRVWLHHTDLLRVGAGGAPEFIPEKLEFYRTLIERLWKKGVRRLTGMNHCYLYPPAFTARYGAVPFNVIPLPDGEFYAPFLSLLEAASELAARAFPEVAQWEPGNEVNFDRFIAKPGYPFENAPREGEGGAGLTYTEGEKAGICADLAFYAARGVRRANPAARIVLPSPAGGAERTAAFIGAVYEKIESGAFPRGAAAASVKPRDYFDILSYHPYNFDGQSRLLEAFYDGVQAVAAARGDGGRPVFVTEYGYHDGDLTKFGLDAREADARQAAYLIGDYEIFKRLEHVETVHYFRLFDWREGYGIETDFGLFSSPAAQTGIIPKAKGLALFKYFNGPSADIRPLYRFAKVDIQGDRA
ncbi:MAG: hypothetical protein LBL66_09370, partial [Clostridiales bacterium]|nr:hypothetical protein [Clostridiales bacterium]